MSDQVKINIKQRRKHITMNNKYLLTTQKIYMSLSLVTSNPNKGELSHSWLKWASKMVKGVRWWRWGNENLSSSFLCIQTYVREECFVLLQKAHFNALLFCPKSVHSIVLVQAKLCFGWVRVSIMFTIRALVGCIIWLAGLAFHIFFQ